MKLLDMIRHYSDLLTEKERLAEATKLNNAEIDEAKADIAEQMLDDDVPRITCGDYDFSLTPKTAYSKRSDADLAREGLDFFGTLREEGLGDLITETVNAKTLQSAMRAYVEEHGELSEGLASVLNTFDFNDITRRKSTKKGAK